MLTDYIHIEFELDDALWLGDFLTVMIAYERTRAAEANDQLHFHFDNPRKHVETLEQIRGQIDGALKRHRRNERTALARMTGRVG